MPNKGYPEVALLLVTLGISPAGAFICQRILLHEGQQRLYLHYGSQHPPLPPSWSSIGVNGAPLRVNHATEGMVTVSSLHCSYFTVIGHSARSS